MSYPHFHFKYKYAQYKERLHRAKRNQIAQLDPSGSTRSRGFLNRVLSFFGLSSSKPESSSETGFLDSNSHPISRLRDRR